MQTVRYRMVFASLLTLVLLLPLTAFAYTTPGSGVVWSAEDLAENAGEVITWNETSQRYESTETITIAAGDSVFVFSNFFVNAVSPGQDFSIFGALLVGNPEGAATDSVLVVGENLDQGDGAGGFKVEEGGRLYLNRVVLTGHGADGIDDGVRILNGSATINGCRISEWPGYAARVSGGSMVILNTLFHDNREYTMTANLGSTLEIRNSALIRNNMSTPNSGKTAITIGTQGENYAIIDSCYISGTPNNRQGGIAVWNLLGTSQNAIISNTIVEDCAFGINVQGGNAYAEITNCQLLNNTAYSNAAVSGSGISIYAGGTVRASHNTITGNWWGITIPSGDATNPVDVILGEEDATEYHSEGFNQIYENGNSGSTWGLYNNSSIDIVAQNNYWGSTDLADVALWIYDQNDDASKGRVTYEPIWDGEDPQLPPVITSIEPDGETVQVWNHWMVRFDVEATDPDGNDANLTYEWTINNIDWGTDTFAVADFYGEGTISAVVVVTDEQGLSASESWFISVNGDSEEMGFTSFSPDTLDPQISSGETIDFSVLANSISGEPLEYVFAIDGEVVSETNTYSHLFEEDGEYTIYAFAADTVYNPTPRDMVSWVVTVSTSSVGTPTELPVEFAVCTYPNPFNAEMLVSYSLPQAAQVNVAVFDILGRQVTTLKEGMVQAGVHSLTFDAHNLSSGLYFLKVEAGSWHEIRKITLVR